MSNKIINLVQLTTFSHSLESRGKNQNIMTGSQQLLKPLYGKMRPIPLHIRKTKISNNIVIKENTALIDQLGECIKTNIRI